MKIKKIIVIYFWLFFSSENKSPMHLEDSVMALRGIGHGYYRNLSWFWEESVTALRGIRQCRILSAAEGANMLLWQTHIRAITDSSQSHDGFIQEPWWILLRVKMDCSQSLVVFVSDEKNIKNKATIKTIFFVSLSNISFNMAVKLFTTFIFKNLNKFFSAIDTSKFMIKLLVELCLSLTVIVCRVHI